MKRRLPIKILALGFAALLVLIAIARFYRETFSVESQRKWIQNAVEELTKAGPPSSSTNQSPDGAPWILSDYLIFSNGWAAYKINTVHDDNRVGDVALLRTSDGAVYLSHTHFCTGIEEMMEPSPYSNESCPQPSDAKDFLNHVGRLHGWNLMTKENRLWCVINFPSEPCCELGKKKLWVWIVSNEGTNQVTRFDKRYVVTGSYVSWNTHWLTNDFLVVDVYDHGKNYSPRTYSNAGESNLITSLTFYRDGQTGKFTEKN